MTQIQKKQVDNVLIHVDYAHELMQTHGFPEEVLQRTQALQSEIRAIREQVRTPERNHPAWRKVLRPLSWASHKMFGAEPNEETSNLEFLVRTLAPLAATAAALAMGYLLLANAWTQGWQR